MTGKISLYCFVVYFMIPVLSGPTTSSPLNRENRFDFYMAMERFLSEHLGSRVGRQ